MRAPAETIVIGLMFRHPHGIVGRPIRRPLQMALRTQLPRHISVAAKPHGINRMGKAAKTEQDASAPDLFANPGRAAPARAPARGRRQRRSARGTAGEAGYTAKHIEVLEGLEPVRRRPGMYIGGTDEKALHHLFAEVIDNAMDEALAGHADWIEVELDADGFVTVTDNGRGIPVDPHPKFKNKSALEVIMCTLHAGGKFDSKVYETSGGLHGVGVSVANALSERMEVEVARGQKLYRMAFERGKPKSQIAGRRQGAEPARHQGALPARPADFRREGAFPARARCSRWRARRPICSAASRSAGRAPRNCCAASKDVPDEATFHFADGLQGLSGRDARRARRWCIRDIFTGRAGKTGAHGAANGRWPGPPTPTASSTPTATPCRRRDGGTHEAGLRAALTRGLKDHAERVGQGKRAAAITADDVMAGAGAMLSVFIREPEFQGQTKDRLATAEAQRIVEQAINDPFDHWLAGNPPQANKLLDFVVERAEERLRRRAGKGHRAQDRGAQAAPARQARRLHQQRGRRLRAFHRRGRFRRRLGQAGARPRHPGDPAAARQDPQRRVAPARTSWRRTSSSPTWSRRSAAAPARITATRICATAGSSS